MRAWKHTGGGDRKKMMIEMGFCPSCEIRWTSKYHPGCKYFDAINREESLHVDE